MPTAIIQARSGSTRLPGKVLKKMGGWTVLERCINQLKACNELDRIVVCYPTGDFKIRDECQRLFVECVMGLEDDVLSRYASTAHRLGVETVVRVTSDCPFIQPDIVDDLIKLQRENGGMVSNFDNVNHIRTFPKGFDCEVFPAEWLYSANGRPLSSFHREHVTQYFYETDKYRPTIVTYKPEDSIENYSIDTQEDYEYLCRIADRIGQRVASWEELR